MSQVKVKLSQIIRDFIITLDGDDYASNASDSAIRNFALRGIREIGFDLSKKIKSLKLTVASNDTVALPDDFVDLLKVGIVDSDGVVRVFGNNKNINYSQKVKLDEDSATTTSDFNAGPLDIDGNEIVDREGSKSATTGSDSGSDDFDAYVFDNYMFQGGAGRLYGVGGGHLADEARSSDPEVHVYAEEALRSYMYYKIIERKSTVPANEKQRARAEYYNERRKANSRLSNFTKEEALKTIRKNFIQAPKY